jgi:hypothetical protein
MTSIELAVQQYRLDNPMSRVTGPIKFVRNGGSVRQRGCILCGEVGPTWCGKWPKTMAAIVWEQKHVASHQVCVVHDADDVIPGRICGRPLPCRDHAEVAP